MAKILVVDDEPDIVRFVVKILAARGHEVITSGDGKDALERANRERPDVIILDLQLPRMDGQTVLKELKANPDTRGIPVVVMSAAYVSLDDARRNGHAGADEYVVKPFLREVLIHNVERLLPGGPPAAA